MTRALAAVALLALACAGPSRTTTAAPAPQAAPAQKADAAAAPAKSRLICRTERPTGSNYPRRVCYREEEVDAASMAAQDAHRRATSSATQPRRD